MYFLVSHALRSENYPYLCNVQACGQTIESKGMDREKIEQFGRMIASADNVVLVGHFNPDGDAVGSTVGVYRYLEAMGKKACIIYPNDYPSNVSCFLEEVEHCIVANGEKAARKYLEEAGLLICLDFNSYSRTCEQIEGLLEAMECGKIVVDHHEDPSEIGLAFCDPAASSTCELVYKILSAYNPEYITKDCATALYAGICTDTGSFSYSCSRKDVFVVAGELVERGVDVQQVKRQVMDLSSENRLRLLGYMLKEKLRVFPEQGAAYMAISKKELRMFDFKKGDLEGVVNYALRIEGIRFAALITERKESIRLSFRSIGPKIDLNKFAARYWEGGGHVQAAGGTSSLGFELTCRILEDQIKKKLYEKRS